MTKMIKTLILIEIMCYVQHTSTKYFEFRMEPSFEGVDCKEALLASVSATISGGEMANLPIFFMFPLFGAGGIPDSDRPDSLFPLRTVLCMIQSQFFEHNVNDKSKE
jgi:hypothetical protein